VPRRRLRRRRVRLPTRLAGPEVKLGLLARHQSLVGKVFVHPVQMVVPIIDDAVDVPLCDRGPLVPHLRDYSPVQRCVYGFEHFRAGAERAGKNPDDLDFAAWVCTAIGRDSAAAKQAARSMVGIYASSMPQELLERNGVDPAELTPIVEAMGAGDLAKSIELTSPELAEKLSIAGTPEEVTSKIKAEIEGTGVNHYIAAITDASLVKAFTGQTVEGVATVEEQLRLLADEVMPNFR